MPKTKYEKRKLKGLYLKKKYADKSKQELTVPARELSNLKMVAGNENKYSRVIMDGMLKEWVGIGWVDLHKATADDKRQWPTVVFESDKPKRK